MEPLSFGLLSNSIEQRHPAVIHPLSILIGQEAESRVSEHDQGSAIDFFQPILNVRHHGSRDHEWAGDFEEGRPLDRLDDTPEVTVVVAEVAEPSAARTSFEFHRKCLSIRRFVAGTHLVQNGIKRFGERCSHMNFLGKRECEAVDRQRRCCSSSRRHEFPLSARSLILTS